MAGSIYSLKILSADVAAAPNDSFLLTVNYHGARGTGELTETVASSDVEGIMRGCESIAQHIFHKEFQLNDAVKLHFSLRDDTGLKLWHTRPNLYIKCSLDMKMDWTCHHLSRSFNTMVTLGVIELPAEVPLKGNGISDNEIARVIMDSMASGIEFMGNIMMMRDSIDHDAEVRNATFPRR